MSRKLKMACDMLAATFGVSLLVGGLPAMIFGSPIAQQIGGHNFALLWMATCLLAQIVGGATAIVALLNLESR